MPKVPGSKSTRKQIPLELALIAGFVFPWEDIAQKPCCIEGCDHRCDGWVGHEVVDDGFCSRNNAATIYDERKMPGPVPDPYVGMACPHCVDLILERETPEDPKG